MVHGATSINTLLMPSALCALRALLYFVSASTSLRRFSFDRDSVSARTSARVGQALTQAGTSSLWQRSHFTAMCFSLSLEMTPKGQAMTHDQHPMHRSFFLRIKLLSSR